MVESRDRFDQFQREVMNLGFNPLKISFNVVIYVISWTSKPTWVRKAEVFRRWGWSDDDIRSLFRRHPLYMALSLEKIANGKGFQPSSIAGNLIVLTYSLDKRVIPRCCVIRVLRLRGLIKKDICL